jgi:hypothetical protein
MLKLQPEQKNKKYGNPVVFQQASKQASKASKQASKASKQASKQSKQVWEVS